MLNHVLTVLKFNYEAATSVIQPESYRSANPNSHVPLNTGTGFFADTYFSFETPLKGFLSLVFTSMNLPVVESRFTQCPLGVFVCERLLTAPCRLPPPDTPLVAIATSYYFGLN